MGRAVLTCRDARVRAGDLDVEVGISNGVADLLEGSACREHREGCSHRSLAGCSKTCGNADHISLRNTAVKEAVGMRVAEDRGIGSRSKVGVQYDYIGSRISHLAQSLTEAHAGRFCNYFSHITPPVPQAAP